MPNYRIKSCQITEKIRAKLPKIEKFYYFCGVKDLIYKTLHTSIKMTLTATGEYAYRRPEDGIYIVPIGGYISRLEE